MIIKILFLIIIVQRNVPLGVAKQDRNPAIMSINGNLMFIGAKDRNISFESANVLINGEDMLALIKEANKARKSIDDFHNIIYAYSNRMEILENEMLNASRVSTNISGPGSEYMTNIINWRLNSLKHSYTRMDINLNKNECDSAPCKHGGTCIDLYSNFMCLCPQGWEGKQCDADVNECTSLAGTDLGCQNGATCHNSEGTFTCTCAIGWFGVHCTKKSADCSTGGADLCGHGICISTTSNTVGYKCLCDQGWTTDGSSPACTVDVDECTLNHPPCSVNPRVNCLNTPGSFRCNSCPTGYFGNGYYCADVDECAFFNGGCSLNPVVQCINTPGSRTCGDCPPGYTGDGVTCVYRGVCQVNNGGCHPSAECRRHQTIGTTECICPLGYTGNGIGATGCTRTGQSLDPCTPNPCANGFCSINTFSGDYTCRCNARYTGRNCDVPKNPCASSPCLNGGTCRKFAGTFKCLCTKGFTDARCETEMQVCGGRLKSDEGTLKYPPEDLSTYNNRVSCAWVIQALNSSKVLNITFTKFNLERSRGCTFDWLQIHDGKNSAAHPLGRFCGNKLPNNGTIISTNNVIYLWFRSDHSVSKGGFELSWTTTTPYCGEIITVTSHGSIQSPGSPGNYPPNRDCFWSLSASNGKRLLFHFFSLMIGNNPNCDYDYLEFISGSLPSDTVFSKFCNTSRPPPLYSPGREVLIHFHSDARKAYPGFVLTYSIVESVPGCGGVYTAASGEIRSPTVDGRYMSQMLCEYKIKLIDSKIKLVFLSFDIEQSKNCKFDYVSIHEGANMDAPLVLKTCGNKLPGPYVSYGNEVTIVFKTDWSTASAGFVIQYETVCGGKYIEPSGSITFDDTPNLVKSRYHCDYLFEQPIGRLIQINVTILVNPLATESVCIGDYLQFRDGDDDNSPLVSTLCREGNYFFTSSQNYFLMKFTRNLPTASGRIIRNFIANYTTIDVGCGGTIKEKVGTISTPSEGSGYPALSSCTWVLKAPPRNIIKLTWMTFSLEQHQDCVYDNVMVFDNNTDNGLGVQIGKFCGSAIPPTLLSTSNVLTVKFTSDAAIHLNGFLASYMFLSETDICGGNYYSDAGILKSPQYPSNYPTNKDCTWTISVETGHQIMLNISDFNVESFNECKYDYLEIRNGGSSASPLIGKFCDGVTIPKRIPSHTNKIYLRFVSDPTKTGRGFKLNWYSTATGCGGTLSSPKGTIISPNYPESYSRNTACSWKIAVNAGSRIQLLFADLDLEKQTSCILDYVEVFDGNSNQANSLGRYCTESRAPPLTSTGNHMFVQFRSDVSFQGRGFQIQYNTICNTTLTGFSGVIESPNFPNSYPQNLDCLWEIKIPNKNKVQLVFSDFQLEYSPIFNYYNKSCKYDYLKIKYLEELEEYDYSEEATFKDQGLYCGDKSPGKLTLNSSHVQLQFVTDNLLVGKGFRVEWQLIGCGGIFTHPEGVIQSPNYPHAYPHSVECVYQIMVPLGNSIEVTFNDVDVETDVYDCSFDAINVYNGWEMSNNLLARICHQTKKTVVTSSGNKMMINFTADTSNQGKGFSANYTTKPSICGGTLTAAKGSVFSPNYPKNYNKKDACEWLIHLDDNHLIELEIIDVDLVQSFGCKDNYIKIYDGPSPAYPVLQKICGDTKPNKTAISSYNMMYIEFKSAGAFTSKGFRADYRKNCGARIAAANSSGLIQISRKSQLSHMVNCSWTIVAQDLTQHISLTISLMGSNTYASEDPIKIYNGDSDQSPIIGSYNTRKVPPMLVSDGAAMHIVMMDYVDFTATYSVLDSHCGGTLDAISGFFSTPYYPRKYPSEMECEWTINVALGNFLSLSFSNFELLESDNCNTDYLEIRKFNSSGPMLGVFCGKNVPQNITHQPTLWLLFKSSKMDSSLVNTAKGFYAEYNADTENQVYGTHGIIQSPMYPMTFPDLEVFTWKISVPSRKRILIDFPEFYVEPSHDDNSCYYSSLSIFDGSSDSAPQLVQLCGYRKPDVIKTTSNVAFIKLDYAINSRMGTHFILDWTAINNQQNTAQTGQNITGCGSLDIIDINSIKNYTVSSPGYPNGYAHGLKCEWIFSTISMNHLSIYFSDINLNSGTTFYYAAARCFRDYISVYKKLENETDWQLEKTVCEMDRNQTYKANLYQVTNLLKLVFSTNRFANGTGFQAIVKQNCGGSIFDSAGYIIFDNTTARGYNCVWTVSVKTGRRINLSFLSMNILNGSTSGCKNYLMIKNGKYPDSEILGNGKYCGSALPDALKTSGNNLYIKYVGSVKSVFKLKYEEVAYNCGGQIILSDFDNFTEISSPNYPSIPEPHIECMWTIRGPPGESIQLDFEERFDLTSNRECTKEYVEVRDGGTEFSTLLGRYCKAAPNTQFATDNLMFVKFFTDVDDPKNGFKAKASLATCGGTFRGLTDTITSPSISRAQNSYNCTWNIVAPVDHNLVLKFTKFDLGYYLKSNCSDLYSRLIISTVSFINSSEIVEEVCISGRKIPKDMTFASNRVILKLVAVKSLLNKQGFSATFNASQEDCGGSIKSESGVIQSPGYPAMNHNKRHCRWKIEVPRGRRITFTLEDFDMDQNEELSDQGLIILNGFNPTIRIALIKPTTTDRVFETSENQMLIIFWSTHLSNHRGFKGSFSSNKPTYCDGDFSKSSGTITQPQNLTTYTCNYEHENTKPNQTLSLSTSVSTKLKNPTTQCRYSAAYLYITKTTNWKSFLRAICHTTIKPEITRSPYPLTKVSVGSSTRYHLNFSLSYQTYDCGGILESAEGFITSPGFPKSSQQTIECVWLIKLQPASTIRLQFATFDLDSDCDVSSLVIHNGDLPTFPKIGTYCGSSNPGNLTSQYNTLWLEYKSSQSNSNKKGFNLTYEPVFDGCGGVIHDFKKEIATPNYGSKDYPNNAECLWELSSEDGYYIILSFVNRFFIEDTRNCTSDYVEVFDYREQKYISTGRKCGRNTPTSIKSNGTKMQVLFRSDNKTGAAGFKAKFELKCGGQFTATDTPQTIVSPGYPNAYPASISCTYIIRGTGLENAIIKFEDFDVERGMNGCLYDNVTIGRVGSAPSIYCGTNKPASFQAQVIVVKFQTDKWLNRKGFKFSYFKDACGGNVTTERTISQNANIGNRGEMARLYSYRRWRNLCTWNITAPPNQIVILRINSLSQRGSCEWEKLRVFDGVTANPNHTLAAVCGEFDEAQGMEIHSTDNHMIVVYRGRQFEGNVIFTHGPKEGCGGALNLTKQEVVHSPRGINNLNCLWKITAPLDNVIKVEISAITLPKRCSAQAENCGYIEIRDGVAPNSELIERIEQSDNITFTQYVKISWSSWNRISIKFISRGQRTDDFTITLTPVLSPCGTSLLNVTKQIQRLTSPNYPNLPKNMNCTWLFKAATTTKAIALHFVEFDLTNNSTTSCGDAKIIISDTNKGGVDKRNMFTQRLQTLRMYEFGNSNLMGEHVFCGTKWNVFNYYSIANHVELALRTKEGVDNIGKGFIIEYYEPGCNRNWTELQGRIMDTNSTNDCYYTIEVPAPRTISIYFVLFFSVGSHSKPCTKQGLEIRNDNENGEQLLLHCGFLRPSPIYSKTNKLWIHTWNQNNLRMKYDAIYTSTLAGRGCGGDIFNSKGRISSPFYPSTYVNDTACIWNVQASMNVKINLSFNVFDVRGDCYMNYVSVTTYVNGSATEHKFCTSDFPAVLTSDSKFTLTYQSSSQNIGTGWDATFSTGRTIY